MTCVVKVYFVCDNIACSKVCININPFLNTPLFCFVFGIVYNLNLYFCNDERNVIEADIGQWRLVGF